MAAALVTGHAGFGQGLTLPLINQAALLQGPLAVALALFAAHGAVVSDQSVHPISLRWGMRSQRIKNQALKNSFCE